MSRSFRTTLLILLIATAAILPGCSRRSKPAQGETAFEVDQVYERGPVTVHVRLDTTSITLAQMLLLQFEATVEPGYEVQMPKVDEALKDFGLADWDDLGRQLDADNNVVTTQQYELEPFLSGQYEIPAFTFTFHDANEPDATHELTSEPIAVEVTSLLGEDRDKLVINDIEGVVEPPRKASWWWAWTLGGLVLAAVPLAWWLLRRRQVRELVRIFKPAHEVAYARLRSLVAEKLVEAGRLKEFYERISGILRHYIEDRFELRAPERTTEEFLSELGQTNVLAEPDRAVLAEFLTHCDLVKFAKHAPTDKQIQRSFDLVKDFIERTKSEVSTVDVTDQVQNETGVETEVA